MKKFFIFCFANFVLLLLISACSPSGASPSNPAQVTPSLIDSTSTPVPTATFTPTLTPTPAPTEHPGWLPEGAVTRFGKGIFHNMAASRDGSMVAIAAAGGVYISEPFTGRVINFLESGADAVDVKFSANGDRIFIGLSDIGVQVWDRTSENTWEKNEAFFDSCADRISVSPDGSLLATYCLYTSNNQRLVIWDVGSQVMLYQQKIKIPSRYPNPFAMDFSPDGTDTLVIASNSSISFIEARSGDVKGLYYTPKNELVIDVEFSPDGSKVALVTDSSSVKLIDTATYSELSTINHQSKVYTLSFIDNETILSINEGYYVIQKTYGKIVKKVNKGLHPNHAVLPQAKILSASIGNEVVFLSLESEQAIKKVPGFVYYHWMSVDFSNNGNAFLGTHSNTDYFLVYATEPDNFIYYNASDICNGGKWIRFFGNTDIYFLVECADSIRIVESKTLKTVFQKKKPVWYTNNTEIYRHPWNDERELLALFFENQSGAEINYSIEVWEPINNKNISTFDIDSKDGNSWVMFSPQSKLLAVIPREKGNIQIHETASGKLIQSIPNNATGDEQYMISDTNMLLFIQRQNAVEVYSLVTGERLQKFTGLNTGKSAQGMNYIDETNIFIWYFNREVKNGQVIYFDYYDINTGEKIANLSVDIPTDNTNPFVDDGRNYIGRITDVYFHSENQGETAVVTVSSSNAHDWTHNFIFVIDITNNKIIKTYSFIGNQWFTPDQTPIINGFMFQRKYDTIFKWDVSTNR